MAHCFQFQSRNEIQPMKSLPCMGITCFEISLMDLCYIFTITSLVGSVTFGSISLITGLVDSVFVCVGSIMLITGLVGSLLRLSLIDVFVAGFVGSAFRLSLVLLPADEYDKPGQVDPEPVLPPCLHMCR